MVEDYSELKKINRNFVEIALLRQTQNEKVILTRPEIYSCVRYLDINELKLILQEYHQEDSKKTGTFDLEEDDKDWLINTVLKNCVENYFYDNNLLNTSFSAYIEKILFILSIIKLSDIDNKNIFSLLKRMLSEKSNMINLFQSINLFLELQYRIYKAHIDKQIFIDSIETLINKMVDGRMNGYELIAVSENYLSNLYGYASISNAIFDNAGIINKLLADLSEYDPELRLDIIQNFIFLIYQISNTEIKNIIENYVSSLKINDNIPLYKRVIYNNALIILSFKEFTKENHEEIMAFIEPFIKENSFGSYLSCLNTQIDYMITKMDIKELEDASLKVKEIIRNFQGFERRSVL
jgi:hypothetical protein